MPDEVEQYKEVRKFFKAIKKLNAAYVALLMADGADDCEYAHEPRAIQVRQTQAEAALNASLARVSDAGYDPVGGDWVGEAGEQAHTLTAAMLLLAATRGSLKHADATEKIASPPFAAGHFAERLGAAILLFNDVRTISGALLPRETLVAFIAGFVSEFFLIPAPRSTDENPG